MCSAVLEGEEHDAQSVDQVDMQRQLLERKLFSTFTLCISMSTYISASQCQYFVLIYAKNLQRFMGIKYPPGGWWMAGRPC